MFAFLGWLSFALMLVSFGPYMYAIVRRRCEPSIATWIIWAGSDWLTVMGMDATDELNPQVVAAAIGASAIVILAVRYGKREWTGLDTACLIAALAGAVWWGLTNNPLMAIIAGQSVNAIGAVPTIIRSWSNYRRENRTGWTLGFSSCVCMVLALQKWTPNAVIQPFTFLGINIIMMYILWIRRAVPVVVPEPEPEPVS
jgi:hypothetical protein